MPNTEIMRNQKVKSIHKYCTAITLTLGLMLSNGASAVSLKSLLLGHSSAQKTESVRGSAINMKKTTTVVISRSSGRKPDPQ